MVWYQNTYWVMIWKAFIHLIDKTRSQYNQVQLAGTEFLSDTLMASGNIYWRNLDQSTYNGDLNDEYCEEMTW